VFNLKSLEASKLLQLAKEKKHAAEVSLRLQQRNETFSRESEKKLTEKMEAFAEKRNAQVNALRERLKDHVSNY